MDRAFRLLKRCFSSPLNIAITAALAFWATQTLVGLFRWAVLDAVWRGSSPRACAGVDAACWLFIRSYAGQILYGNYPPSDRWRVLTCLAIGLVSLAVLALPSTRKGLAAIWLMTGFPVFVAVMLHGGLLWLDPVQTSDWGGMLLTLVIAGSTILFAVPLGLALALARRSKLPVLSRLATLYIEIVRGLPLVGILFVAIVLFPLFVPPGVDVNVLVRTLIAFMLFNAANMAEVFRGGMQAVPWGQYEACMALGLGYWRMTLFVVLPQTFRAALPGLVNVAVSIIKETTIVLMAGMFDFLGVLQNALIDPQWLVGDQIRQTAYFFAGLVFFVICLSMSRYSAHIERRFRAGQSY